MKTINDIINEMRHGMIPKHRHDRELLLNYADRIEAAYKREALKQARRVLHCAIVAGILKGEDAHEALNVATAALSDPPRNCDRQYLNAYEVVGRYVEETNPTKVKLEEVIDWLLFAKSKGEK